VGKVLSQNLVKHVGFGILLASCGLLVLIPLLWPISGRAWEADFDAIYCHPALLTDLSVSPMPPKPCKLRPKTQYFAHFADLTTSLKRRS
jgi:hypothetical protein